MNIRVWLCGAMLLAATPIGAGERLVMRVTPAVSFAPGNLVVRATVEADAANRAIAIIAESGDFYRSSEVQLDGERAPRINVFEFRDVPSGSYEVRATLIDASGQTRAQARSQVNVIPSAAAQ